MSELSQINFYGRDFLITKDVLTPRPETEQAIDAVLNLAGVPYLPGVKPGLRQLPLHPVILDVGTGSGCIAITLKKELPGATLYASDVSVSALKIAQKNATKHDAHITFIISYLLKNVNTSDLPTPDLIVANLPYVDKTWPWLDQEALKQDPAVALYAENGGLALIFELIEESAAIEIPHLILEADPCQHDRIVSFAREKGYAKNSTRGYILGFKKASLRESKT